MSKLAATPGTKSYVLFHLSETVEFKTKGISDSDSDLNISNENLGIQHHSVHHNIDIHNLTRLLYLEVLKKHCICTYSNIQVYQMTHLRFKSWSLEDTEAVTERYPLNL